MGPAFIHKRIGQNTYLLKQGNRIFKQNVKKIRPLPNRENSVDLEIKKATEVDINEETNNEKLIFQFYFLHISFENPTSINQGHKTWHFLFEINGGIFSS